MDRKAELNLQTEQVSQNKVATPNARGRNRFHYPILAAAAVTALVLASLSAADKAEAGGPEPQEPSTKIAISSNYGNGEVDLNIYGGSRFSKSYEGMWISMHDLETEKGVTFMASARVDDFPGAVSLHGKTWDIRSKEYKEVVFRPGATYVLLAQEGRYTTGTPQLKRIILRTLFTVGNFPGQQVEEADGTKSYPQCGVTDREIEESPEKAAYGKNETVLVERAVKNGLLTFQLQGQGVKPGECGNRSK